MDKNLKAKCAIRALNIASAMEDSDEVSEDAISSVQRTLKSGPPLLHFRSFYCKQNQLYIQTWVLIVEPKAC